MSGAVAAVLLAAGRGLRFGVSDGTSKVVAALDGVPMVRHVAEAALASRAAPLVVVTGHAAPAVRAALAGCPAIFAHNADYAAGLSTSLIAGIAALPAETAGALILLGDMPRVTAAACDRLVACFERTCVTGLVDAVVPVHAGREGNPVLIGRSLFADLGRLQGDAGARRLLTEPGRRVARCEVGDEGIWLDVDTREALGALWGRVD